MTSRGSYEVANMEEVKQIESDTSYRSCIATLLIFLFFCVILIIVGAFLKTSNPYVSKESNGAGESGSQQEKMKITTMEVTKHELTNVSPLNEKNGTDVTSSTSKFTVTVSDIENITGSTDNLREFAKFQVTKNITETESITERQDAEEYRTLTTEDNAKKNTTFEEASTVYKESSEITTAKYEEKNSTEIMTPAEMDNDYKKENIITTSTNIGLIPNENITDTSTTEIPTKLNESTFVSITEGQNIEEYRISTTEEYEKKSTKVEEAPTFYKELNEVATVKYEEETTTKIMTPAEMGDDPTKYYKEENSTNIGLISNENTANTSTTEISTKLNESTTETVSITEGQNIEEYRISTTDECGKKNVMNKDVGQKIASKMLFFMNLTVNDPCEDFYEYACGGFEANPQTVDRDLADEAYQRILREMKKTVRKNKSSSIFATYYNSCINYEHIDYAERIRLAKLELDRVGKFYNATEEPKVNFTKLIAKLLLSNSPLLFDVVPDLEEYNSDHAGITFRIGPVIDNSPFNTDEPYDPCFDANEFERKNETVDLGNLYEGYKKCKSNKLVESVTEALRAFGVDEDIIASTNNSIGIYILTDFLLSLPSKEKIREAYLTKNYTTYAIEKLENNFIYWELLINLLMEPYNITIDSKINVQVYLYDALNTGLKKLQYKDGLLQNALLGLYAHKLYHELVLPKQQETLKKHCLRVAANLLVPEASNLYSSSFSTDELEYMDRTIRNVSMELKKTLRSEIEKVKWASKNGRNTWIAKVDDLTIVTPISYFTDNNFKMYQANEGQFYVNLTDNYFTNSMFLMHRYRKLMYAEFSLRVGSPEHIWRHYAKPYQSNGLAIYDLNLVAIPFGAIDWSIKYDKPEFNYITLATLGNMIAHQIAHHFDANGIYYWNGIRNFPNATNTLLEVDNDNSMNFEDYINHQENILFGSMDPLELPSGQTVHYNISQLSLNERLSDKMGLKLAYDTLVRLRSAEVEEVTLPWLQLNSTQLFYLAYAQMHCTKTPLTSSYVALHENEKLPSRIRILDTALHTRILGEAWNCKTGSKLMPSYVCNTFPYLECSLSSET